MSTLPSIMGKTGLEVDVLQPDRTPSRGGGLRKTTSGGKTPKTPDKRVAFPGLVDVHDRSPEWTGSWKGTSSSRQSTASPGRPESKGGQRWDSANSLKGFFRFSVADFVRSQDAAGGFDPLYLETKQRPMTSKSQDGSGDATRQPTPASAKHDSKAPGGGRRATPTKDARKSTPKTAGSGGGGGRTPSGTGSRPGSGERSIGSSHGEGMQESAFAKAKREQAEKLEREEAKRREHAERTKQQRIQKTREAVTVLQARCRWRMVKIGTHPHTGYWIDLTIFLNKDSSIRIISSMFARLIRSRYEACPPITESVEHWFPGVERSHLGANWMCAKALRLWDEESLFLANEALGFALDYLHEAGVLLDMTRDDVFDKYFLDGGDRRKHQALLNPFCATPGCSRRPIKTCEWDEVSKTCEEHQYTALWDRESKALVYTKRHKMNVAMPSRRDFFWASFMLGLHPRLGSSEKCFIQSLVLGKEGQHGMDKYGGNPLHFIEKILDMSFTVTVPDEYATVDAAVLAVPDQTVIRVRGGYHTWVEPIEVRRRIDVVGEAGTVLHGTWVMDDCSGGGCFRGVRCIGRGGRCVQMRGGCWTFEDCSLQHGGDGTCVVACCGNAQLRLVNTTVSGIQEDNGRRHNPWYGIQLGETSTVDMSNSRVCDAAGYGLAVSEHCTANVNDSKLDNNSLAAVRFGKNATVTIRACVLTCNGAVVEAVSRNIPHEACKYDKFRKEFFEATEADCLQMTGCTISGTLFATGHRPTYVLGQCANRMAIDKGDIMKDNTFVPGSVPPRSKLPTGHGNEGFARELPDNSSVRCTDGSDFIEPFVRQRMEIAAVLTRPLRGWTPQARNLVWDIEDLADERAGTAKSSNVDPSVWEMPYGAVRQQTQPAGSGQWSATRGSADYLDVGASFDEDVVPVEEERSAEDWFESRARAKIISGEHGASQSMEGSARSRPQGTSQSGTIADSLLGPAPLGREPTPILRGASIGNLTVKEVAPSRPKSRQVMFESADVAI